MSNLLEVKEIGNYRIKVYRDEDAPCPCTDGTMAGLYFWDNEFKKLSKNCNCYDLGGSAKEVLASLVCKYVKAESVIHYIKSLDNSSYRISYENDKHVWRLKQLYMGEWYDYSFFTPREIKNGSCLDELCEVLEENDLCKLLKSCKDIAFIEWESRGYSQGDYISGYAFCDKERFINFDKNTNDWRNRAKKWLQGDAKVIGKWLFGDAIGYVLEEKVLYKKVFEDSARNSEEGYDWEEIDSCWGFYMDTDELIDEVENDIKKIA